ncbi:MAG: hypothetical protein HETSPECPRED_008212 [Heterodermia speciosa]|uniref:mRNA stability protein n=1 Tax=Heterodermia speciosa TaxID=116794 RepID=A0A8H3ISP4_9LECA|nr:MAG: hypothetical protein HETSPECPRED_008212 [Heterodermia speciosa]
MNPLQKNKVDISSLTEEEQKLFRLYGKLPNKKDLLQNKLKERKYFDSGDYALSKAGKASEGGVTTIGSQHPLPENIPHLASPGPGSGPNGNGNGSVGAIPGGQSGSPVKESSFLQRSESVDEGASPKKEVPGTSTSPPTKEDVPVRWQH